MGLFSKGRTKHDFFDFFLLSGGSDYRAYEVLREMKSRNVVINKVLLFNFAERIKDINKSDPYYKYQKIGVDNISTIECSIKDPNSCLQQLVLF